MRRYSEPQLVNRVKSESCIIHLPPSLVPSLVFFFCVRPLTQVLQLCSSENCWQSQQMKAWTLRLVTCTTLATLTSNKSWLLTKLKLQHLQTCCSFQHVLPRRIVTRAYTSIMRGLELEIWEQNYCLSTSNKTGHALLMANEISRSKAFS